MSHPTPRFVEVQFLGHTLHARASPRPDGTRLLVFGEVLRLAKGVSIQVDGEPCEVVVAADEWCIVRR
jgi:hypothetical protein